MKKNLLLLLVFTFALGLSPGWSQTGHLSHEKEMPPAAGEKGSMKHEMMPKMQENLKEMQQILGQAKITPEQQKKMQEMVTQMQGMMTQMHEKMMTMSKGKMEMCPMMKNMEEQGLKIKSLEERLDRLEKATGK